MHRQVFLCTAYGKNKPLHHKEATCYFLTALTIRGTKPLLMLSRTIINRIIILGFMGIVGFSIANAIYSHSVLGVLLSCLSLSAGIYFLYLLAKAKQERETEEAR